MHFVQSGPNFTAGSASKQPIVQQNIKQMTGDPIVPNVSVQMRS